MVIGSQVREMLNTNAWREHVGPLLDTMITDVLGGKENGRWHNGTLDDNALSEDKLRELQMYKAGLVNFHSGVMKFIDDADDAISELDRMSKESQ
jgi:hypothetical protein